MFTIVIPLYNKLLSISATIESVLKQTVPDFELLIINDGSTDGSEKVVEQFNDLRIKYITRANKGLSATRNEGITKAAYDLITVLDADDTLDLQYLEKMKSLIEEFPDCDVYSSSYDIQRKGKIIKHKLNLPFEHKGIIDDYFFWQMKNTIDLVWTCVSVVRRSAFIRAGMYDERLNRGEDLDIWYRIFPEGKLAFLNEALALYGDSDPNNRMTSTKNMKSESDMIFFLEKYKEREQKYPQIKKLLDYYRLKFLRPYYMEGKNDEKIKTILSTVDKQSFSVFSFLFYKVIPRSLLRTPYVAVKTLKRITA